MRTIRKFAYAAVLILTMFSLQPTLAAAEDARGVFTLSHEVHWQKCVLRPGDYAFSIKTSKLVLVSRKGQSFVSAMQLPAYEMTLNFAVPPEKSSK